MGLQRICSRCNGHQLPVPRVGKHVAKLGVPAGREAWRLVVFEACRRVVSMSDGHDYANATSDTHSGGEACFGDS